MFEGYCPLAKGEGLQHAVVRSVAAAHGKSEAQVLIRWSLQHGVVTIPKSTDTSRIKENSNVFNFELTKDEMAQLDALHCNLRVTWDPTGVV